MKGNPGSPYSISDWHDVNPYLADNPEKRIEEFEHMVSRTHRAGLKCLIDFIPNHVAKDYEGSLRHFDYCDYDWTDTVKNDWSDPGTLKAAVDILLFWASKGVDGFRCDMVELVPAEAMKALISGVKEHFPGTLFVAEVYGRENYRKYIEYVGFDLLYDKSGVYDILRSIMCSGGDARALTWNWQSLQDLQPHMLNFLENHDEQRVASPFFATSARNSFAALAYAMLFNTASFMIYFGQETGESAAEGHEGRTSIFNWSKPASISDLYRHISEKKELLENERTVLEKYSSLLSYAKMPVFSEGNVWDLCYCQPDGSGFNPERHTAFLRYLDGEAYVVVCNFSGEDMSSFVEIPQEPLGKPFKVRVEVPARDSAIIRII